METYPYRAAVEKRFSQIVLVNLQAACLKRELSAVLKLVHIPCLGSSAFKKTIHHFAVARCCGAVTVMNLR